MDFWISFGNNTVMRRQQGFSHVLIPIAIVVIALIAGTGLLVWHHRQHSVDSAIATNVATQVNVNSIDYPMPTLPAGYVLIEKGNDQGVFPTAEYATNKTPEEATSDVVSLCKTAMYKVDYSTDKIVPDGSVQINGVMVPTSGAQTSCYDSENTWEFSLSPMDEVATSTLSAADKVKAGGYAYNLAIENHGAPVHSCPANGCSQ